MINSSSRESIFALSTSYGQSAIAVIRISGEQAKKIAGRVCGRTKLAQRYAYLCKIKDLQGKLIDEGMVVFFKSPKSYTGEDLLEIHTHGSIAVINRLIKVLSDFPQTRPALPGEFSKRAFQNGKGNLLKYEGLNNLILSETENQRLMATKQTFGESENICFLWREGMARILAMIDAVIEFSDDVDTLELNSIEQSIRTIINQTHNILKNAEVAKELNFGFNILIFGPPNVGKSSFFNLLCQDDKTITSNLQGTTRDQTSSQIDLFGNKINITDSAGIRETRDPIEKKGIKKTFQSLSIFKKLILVLSPDSFNKQNVDGVFSVLKKIKRKKMVVIFNKTDLSGSKRKYEAWTKHIPELTNYYSFEISCKNSRNNSKTLEPLFDFINQNLIAVDRSENDDYYFSDQRQLECIKRINSNLKNSLEHLRELEISADFLRNALKETDDLYGRSDEDNKLGIIFKNFCIGK